MTPSARIHAPRRRPTRRVTPAALAPAALLFAGLAGCDYSVTVRNDSSKTVLAEVRHDRFLAPTARPDSAMLEPGDAADFGPFKIDPLEPIHIRARIVGDTFGGWQEERLEPGNQTIVIDDGTLQSWEAIALRRESASDRRGSHGEQADRSADRPTDRPADRRTDDDR